tara:strand:- start:301 stop:861 length:561 start_codon:yes stop_codon:yes gene_type:complete
MGTFGITYGLVGKALAIGGGTATITPTSAWEFENQSGTLGTNLTGSSIYSGTGGNIVGILSGTVGIQGEIQTATVVDGGSGYATAADVPVINPESGLGTGAELDVTAVGGVITVAGVFGEPGSGYRQGDIVTVSGGDGNATIRINVLSSNPNATDAVTFNAVPAGTILPVAFDYILSGPADMVALK